MSTAPTALRSLYRWSARSHLLGAVALGAGTAFLHLVSAPAYAAAGRAFPGGLARVAQDAAPLAKSLEILTGPPDRLDTIAGYLSYKVFPTTALMFAIYAAVQGTRALRGAEQPRLSDTWLIAGMSRRGVLGARAAAFVTMLAGACAITWLGTVVGGAAAGVDVAAAAALQCLAIAGVGAVAYGLALVLSQVLSSARVAMAVAAGWMVGGYVVANAGDQLGALSFLRALSPFTAYVASRALVPGGVVSPVAMPALALAALGLVAVAAVLEQRRDVDAGLLLGAESRSSRHPFRPSRLARRGLWADELTSHRVMAAGWFAGIAAFTAIEAGLAPQALKIIEQSAGPRSGFLRDLTLTAYTSAVVSFAALLGCGVAIHLCGRWVSDSTHRRDEGILTGPVSWTRYVGARAAVLLTTATVVAGGGTAAGLALGDALGGTPIDAGGLGRIVVVLSLLAWAVGGVGLAMTAAFRNAGAVVVTGAVVLVSSLVATVVPLLHWPSWTSAASLLQAAGQPYTALPASGSLVYLAGCGAVGAVAAVLLMRAGLRVAA